MTGIEDGRAGATWAELFDRAAAYDASERDVRDALAERRDE